MPDVDITSLSVEISAESQGAELNIDKLATAISNLRTKGNVTKVVNSLDKLSASISALKSASAGLSGLDKLTGFLDKLSGTDLSASAKSINSVGNAIKKIAAVDISGLDLSGLSGKMSELQSGLSPLVGLDVSGLKGAGSAINALGKIPDLTSKLDSSTLDAFAIACEKISTSLTPLASQLDKVGNAFAKLPPQLSKVVTQANRVTAANEKQKKSYLSLSNQVNSFMRNMAKLVSLKAIATYLGNAVASFNDFYEATDLFHNAMGDLSDEADSLISKMQELAGVDPTKAMTYMATIQSLGTSFGLASDKAYVLSKNLTQLAYDEASYWNKDVSETFTAMSSAISGEIEPIRRLGIDLSQARLQQELLALGFNKQVSSLSQADKAVLRYIAIMKQTANIQGNLAQTIQSPANQIKILKAQLDMLAKSVGQLLYPALKSILPPLIAAVQLIREFVEWVAKLMGVKVVFTDFSKSAGSVGDIGDAMDDTAASTNKAAKALKDYTMGFDELNVIDPTQGSSGSSGSGGSAGNILGDVDLSGYDMFADYVGTQIDEIKQKIKDMLPIIGAVTAALALWKIVDFLTDVSTAIAKMTDLQKLALSIATVVIEASLVFSFAKGYASTGNPLDLLGEVVSAAFGSFVLWRTMGADGITLGMGVAFVASLAGLTYALGTGEANLGDASTWIQAALTTAFGSITGITLLTNLGVASGTAATLSIGLAGLITFTGITFSLGEKLKEFPVLDTIITALMGIFGGVAGAGVALLVGASLPVAGAVAAAGVGIGLVLHWAGIKWGAKEGGEETEASKEANEKMSALEQVFEQKIESIKQIIVTKWNAAIDFMTSLPEKVGNIVNNVVEWFSSLPEQIGEIVNNVVEWFSSLPEKIGYALGFAAGTVGSWVGDMITTVVTEVPKIISSIVEFFEGIPGKILVAILKVLDTITEWRNKVIAFIAVEVPKIISSIIEFFIELPGKILTAILKALDAISDWRKKMIAWALIEIPKIISSIIEEFKKIGDGLKKLGKFIWDGLIQGLKDAWHTVTDGIKSFSEGFINGFKDALGIHSPSKVFHEIAGYVVQGFVNGINEGLPHAEQAVTNFANKVKEAGEGMIDAGESAANDYLDGFFSGLDSKWSEIKSNLQNDFTGTVKSLVDAVKQGDIKTVGTTTAAIIWQAMGEQNRTEVKSYANNLVSSLVKVLKNANNQIYGAAKNVGTSILKGITSQFNTISTKALDLSNKIMTSFSSMTGPMATTGNAISLGLSGGILSQFPKIIAGVAGLIGQIGTAFMGILQTIGGVLTSLGIPTGVLLLAGGVAIAAAIAGIVGTLGGKYSSSGSSASVSTDTSKYPGTSDYDKTYGSSSASSSSYTASSGASAEELRSSVYNGCYNAFLDIFQRYGDELTGGKELKIYLDGKQITASVERQQSDRGMQIMGSEVYSY